MTSPDPNAQGGTGSASSGADGGQGTDPANAGNTGAPSGNSNSGQGQGTGQQQNQGDAKTVSQADFDALTNRLRAADQKREEAQKALKELVEKDLPAQQKLQKELAEANAERDKLREDLRKTRMENAFLNDNTFKWKNPKTALKLADLSKVEIDEDGTVRNLSAALEALAKSDPYLLEDKEEDDEDPKDKGKGSTGAPGTGQKQEASSIKGLASRLPAMRTRGLRT